jgi:hypothetical protein
MIKLSLYTKKAIIDLAKFVAHDLAIEGVWVIAIKAAEGVAAISLYLGIGSIISAITGGGGGGSPPAPINISALNNQ